MCRASRSPVTSLVPDTAGDQAVRFVRSLIFTGELRPGDRLPAERTLAADLGISRVTLRLALKTLEGAGYIISTRGRNAGWRVKDLDALLRCWSTWAAEHTDELEDIFELRQTVETRIASLAAERRTPQELGEIEAADALFSEVRASLFRWDVRFHDALARAAHSRRLEQSMNEARGELFLPVDQALHEHRAEDVRAFHRTILAAVREQDPPRAAKAMAAHIDDTHEMVFRALAEQSVARRPHALSHRRSQVG
jgi:GntR family transcriptional repressor for pyruvate dehydrogenase complex